MIMQNHASAFRPGRRSGTYRFMAAALLTGSLVAGMALPAGAVTLDWEDLTDAQQEQAYHQLESENQALREQLAQLQGGGTGQADGGQSSEGSGTDSGGGASSDQGTLKEQAQIPAAGLRQIRALRRTRLMRRRRRSPRRSRARKPSSPTWRHPSTPGRRRPGRIRMRKSVP